MILCFPLNRLKDGVSGECTTEILQEQGLRFLRNAAEARGRRGTNSEGEAWGTSELKCLKTDSMLFTRYLELFSFLLGFWIINGFCFFSNVSSQMFKRRNVDMAKSSSQPGELETLLTTNHVGQVRSCVGFAQQNSVPFTRFHCLQWKWTIGFRYFLSHVIFMLPLL